jgi:hypothetical protein
MDGQLFRRAHYPRAPTLTIDSGAGTATISGIAGLSIATIINNGGYFNQTLSSTPYVATKRYTVWTNITSGELLDLGLLTDTGVGVALRSGGTTWPVRRRLGPGSSICRCWAQISTG